MVAATGCALIAVSLYRWSWRRDRRRLQELSENYRGIYRVSPEG
jgi:hypothetical protein